LLGWTAMTHKERNLEGTLEGYLVYIDEGNLEGIYREILKEM